MSPTKKYIKQLLTTPFDRELHIDVEIGQGAIVLQRIRSELSRIRKAMNQANETYQSFTLSSEIETDKENMIDRIVLIRRIKGRNTIQTNLLEAMNLMKKDVKDEPQLS